ncbi:MAG: SulP family inorganic anion transporter [Planctomycetota bacterium]
MNRLANLRHDVPASIVVFFVAVPLCLGIALASGAPLVSGLISGIIGGIVVGLISGSPLGVSGPAAGLAVIVLTAIEDLGSFEVFLLAVIVAGLVQMGLGLARAGVLGYFFPTAVIQGMLAGIGILIILKQIPHAVGHDTDPEGSYSFQQADGETTLSALEEMLGHIAPSAVFVSVVCLAILLLWDRILSHRAKIFQVLQGPIVAVVFGIVYEATTRAFAPSWALSKIHLVNVPVANTLAEARALLTFPDWSQITNLEVWITGIVIAVVASLETLLCVDATDKLDPFKRVTPTNRELFAQGVGNVSAGLIGGIPVTQVIVRSSANIQSGGRTKASAVMHGTFILVFALAAPRLLNLIPLAALASVLLVVGSKLARPALFKRMYAQGWGQFAPFLITVVGIVFTDLLTGIALGMGAAVFVILRTHYRNSHCLHIEESNGVTGARTVRMELAEEVTFLNKGAILKELGAIPDGSRVTIDASRTVFIDHDVLEIFNDFEASAERRNILVSRTLKPVPPPGTNEALKPALSQ